MCWCRGWHFTCSILRISNRLTSFGDGARKGSDMGLNRLVVVFAAIFTMLSGHPALVQSPDVDRPTLLKSIEQKVTVDRPGEHYYCVRCRSWRSDRYGGHHTSMSYLRLFDPNMNEIVEESILNGNDYEEQKLIRVH